MWRVEYLLILNGHYKENKFHVQFPAHIFDNIEERNDFLERNICQNSDKIDN